MVTGCAAAIVRESHVLPAGMSLELTCDHWLSTMWLNSQSPVMVSAPSAPRRDS